MSYFLATIKTDVPIELNMDELKLVEPDNDKLRQLFTELEFKQLADKLLKKPQKASIPANGQLDLFAEFPADGKDTNENSSFESLKTVTHNYKLVDNEEEMVKLRDYFLTNEILSLDTETTSTSAIDAELVGLSFAVKEFEAFYVPIPPEREKALQIVNIFKSVYEDPKILKVGQNLKYALIIKPSISTSSSVPRERTSVRCATSPLPSSTNTPPRMLM